MVASTLFNCIPIGSAPRNVRRVVEAIKKVYELLNLYAIGGNEISDCAPDLRPRGGSNRGSTSVNSFDPNEKQGSTGAGRNQYLTTGEPLKYIIRFENQETATAPAQTVTIRDTLDRSVFDPTTIELGFVSFGDTIIIPSRGLKNWQTEIGLYPDKPYTVRVQAHYNDTTGVLTWYYSTLNPATLAPVVDPSIGFLPPNDSLGHGRGAVFFTIATHPNIPAGRVIRNRASIIFDNNDPILTPAWVNTADNSPPTSRVAALTQQSPTRFRVSWSGTDSASGVRAYSIYYAVNGNGPRLWKYVTDSTYGTFTGALDSTYAFYSIAQDSAGNWELPPASYDASTVVTGTSLQETAARLRVDIVPNPNTGSFTYSITGLRSQAALEVMDLQGRIVFTQPVSSGAAQSLSIQLPGASKGLYMVRIRSEQGSVVRRMAVE